MSLATPETEMHFNTWCPVSGITLEGAALLEEVKSLGWALRAHSLVCSPNSLSSSSHNRLCLSRTMSQIKSFLPHAAFGCGILYHSNRKVTNTEAGDSKRSCGCDEPGGLYVLGLFRGRSWNCVLWAELTEHSSVILSQ